MAHWRTTADRFLTGKVLAGTVAVGSLAATLSSSSAASQAQRAGSTWTVPISGVGTAVNSRVLLAWHGPTGFQVSCDEVVAKASAKRGTGLSGDGIISISSVRLQSADNPGLGCTGPQGVGVKIVASGLPWRFNARSHDPGTGVTNGRLSGVTVTVTDDTLGCTLTVAGPGGTTGEVDASYRNSSGEITIADRGHLRITTATETCQPLAVGDEVDIDGVFTMVPRGVITSP